MSAPEVAPISAVLFDLDGTLADTLPGLAAAMNDALAAHSLPATEASAMRPFVSGGTAGMLLAAAPGLPGPGDALHDKLAKHFLDSYAQQPARGIGLFDGMAAVLDGVTERGLRWGIVTNKRVRFTAPVVAALGVGKSAACVVSGDTTARPKPAPDPLLHAARQLGVRNRHCVYIGDARNDMVAARAAHMACLAAGWGYLAAGDEPQDWNADACLARPTDLLDWLDRDRTQQR